MKHLLLFAESRYALDVISYDFDGVLHASVVPGTLHPESLYGASWWVPRLDMHDQLRADARHHRVVVVTSRSDVTKPEIERFLHRFNLPVAAVHCTNGDDKVSYIEDLWAIRHYDDDPSLEEPLTSLGIEFVLSQPPNTAAARPVVSFDFDGVLHGSVVPGTLNPINFDDVDSWVPRLDVHAQVRAEAEDNRVVVITARDEYNREQVQQFIDWYDLPIDAVYCTSDRPKYPIMKQLGVVRHYDDNPEMARKLDQMGIEFVLSVPPASRRR